MLLLFQRQQRQGLIAEPLSPSNSRTFLRHHLRSLSGGPCCAHTTAKGTFFHYMCGKTLCMEFLEKFRGTRERSGHIFGILTLLFPIRRSFARRFFASLSGKMCNAFLISARPEPGTKKLSKKERKKEKIRCEIRANIFFPVTALQ